MNPTPHGLEEVEIPAWFIEGLKTLNDPDQGMKYVGAHFGKRFYDTKTGEPYMTSARPTELTVYSSRADFLYRLIREAETIAHLLAHKEAADPVSQPQEEAKP